MKGTASPIRKVSFAELFLPNRIQTTALSRKWRKTCMQAEELSLARNACAYQHVNTRDPFSCTILEGLEPNTEET